MGTDGVVVPIKRKTKIVRGKSTELAQKNCIRVAHHIVNKNNELRYVHHYDSKKV